MAHSERRLLSLDVFRGITIAGMIVVNSPGNKTAYRWLDHSEWNGCTTADLVFPFFLFIVGVSIVLSMSTRLARGDSQDALLAQTFRRSLILFGLGMTAIGLPNLHPETVRIPGVLQRIALCYGASSFLFLKTRLRTHALVAAGLLLGYWLLMTAVPVPGLGRADLSPEGNLAAYVDRLVFGRHIYHPGRYDPEGLLSTLPALGTTLLGVLTGHWLRGSRSPREKALGMVAAGTACALLGPAWDPWFPINKSLWTSSYALYTGGLALLLLALCYWAIELKGWRGWGRPFEVFGVNSIAAYVLSILVIKVLVYTKVAGPGGTPVQLRLLLCGRLFGGWLSPPAASAAFALAYTLVWLGFFWVLYRRRVFIKL